LASTVVELGRARRLRPHDDFTRLGIVERMRGHAVPDVHHLGLAIGAAEPVDLDGIKARSGGRKKRRRRHAVERGTDHAAIERPVVVERVGHGETAGARLVLHDDARRAGNVRCHVAREQPRIDVVARADADADHDPQRLAAKESGSIIVLRERGRERSNN
jgi:hypothetical protein